MSTEASFAKLKDFFENRPVAREAAQPLKKDVEIGIIIDGQIECAFFKELDIPRFERRPAKKPDAIFSITAQGVDQLVATQSEDIGELGITILKAYAHKQVHIKVTGPLLNFVTRGYLGVISKGGITFSKYLASKGLTSLGKIKTVISELRK